MSENELSEQIEKLSDEEFSPSEKILPQGVLFLFLFDLNSTSEQKVNGL